MQNEFILSLRETVDQQWTQIKSGRFWNHVMNRPVTREFYHDLMVEIHHYTKHNSMNQAVTAFVNAPEGLLRFAYQHAAEEVGHERMVIHDLESIGLLDRQALEREPLPATEALIGYLYFVALRYGAVARLGYSFWAESVYGHIGDALSKIRSDLSLNDRNMSFFVAHSTIDRKHIAQVEDCIDRYVKTPADQSLVRSTAETTLFLTGQLLEQVAQRHS